MTLSFIHLYSILFLALNTVNIANNSDKHTYFSLYQISLLVIGFLMILSFVPKIRTFFETTWNDHPKSVLLFTILSLPIWFLYLSTSWFSTEMVEHIFGRMTQFYHCQNSSDFQKVFKIFKFIENACDNNDRIARIYAINCGFLNNMLSPMENINEYIEIEKQQITFKDFKANYLNLNQRFFVKLAIFKILLLLFPIFGWFFYLFCMPGNENLNCEMSNYYLRVNDQMSDAQMLTCYHFFLF